MSATTPAAAETVPTIPTRRSRLVPSLIWAHVLLVLFAVATVYYNADKARRVTVRSLAVYSALPEFALTDSNGVPFGSVDLEGYAWIASFATIAGTKESNLVIARLQELQSIIQNAPSAKLVTFSLNPEQETPERLHEFAAKHRKTGQWVFLTGSRAEVMRVMREGFRLPLGEAAADASLPLPASSRLVLVDREGNIRGYYDASKIDEVRALASDIGQTLE